MSDIKNLTEIVIELAKPDDVNFIAAYTASKKEYTLKDEEHMPESLEELCREFITCVQDHDEQQSIPFIGELVEYATKMEAFLDD